MPVIPAMAALFALFVIALIGLDMLVRAPKRREEGGVRPAVQTANADPVNLRRRRPLTQRLSGAVLIVAVLVLLIVLRPALGIF